MTYPGGFYITYGYDAAHELTSMVQGSINSLSLGYSLADQITSQSNTNGCLLLQHLRQGR